MTERELQTEPEKSVTLPGKETTASLSAVSHASIEMIFVARRKKLEGLKDKICAKFFQAAAEKVRLEEKAVRALLDVQSQKSAALRRYTLPLNTQYFQQKLLPHRNP